MKKIRSYIMVYIVAIVLMCSFSTLGAMIPHSAIEKHSQESVDYLIDHPELYEQSITGDQGSKRDRFADSIMLNIAYSQDETHPFRSAMQASYYDNGILPRLIEDLNEAVYNDAEANTNYTRYWHGSIPLVKSGLVFMNIEQIYIAYTVILAILFVSFLFLLWKRKEYILMFTILIGAVAINLYCVPLSLEYLPIFLVILGGCIGSIYITKEKLYLFLFVLGILTCYFDFLTVETLAYTLPLFCFLVIHEKNKVRNWKEILLFLIKTGLIWLVGYGLAYLTKWGIAGILLGKDEFMNAFFYAEYRFNGTQFIKPMRQLIYAIVNPILALKPLSYTGTYGQIFIVVIIIGVILFSIYYLFRKENTKKWRSTEKIVLLLCLLPYIRYIVLNNHSSMHWFFTFRAQMMTVSGLFYLYLQRIDFRLMRLRKEETISEKI